MEIPSKPNRHISFLLENQHSMTRSISELSAFKEIFASLERSLSDSLLFYKGLLEKTEIQSQTFSDQVLKTFKVFDEKISNLFHQTVKNAEREAELVIRVQNLTVQLEMEKETVAGLREREKKLNRDLAEAESKLLQTVGENTSEKQKLFEIYLKNVQELNEKIEKLKEDVRENDTKVSLRPDEDHFVAKIEKNQDFFPVVDEDVLQKALLESLTFQEKYEKGQKDYQELKKATEDLLNDIEDKTPEISLARTSYDLLLNRYEDLSNEFYQYKQKYFSSKADFELLNKRLSASSEVIISLKSKISTLVSDILTLTTENQKLMSGHPCSAEKTSKLLNSIEANYSLSQDLEKSQQALTCLKAQLLGQSGKIQELSSEISEKNEEIFNLHARLDLLKDFSEYRSNTFASLKEELLRQESQQKDSALKSYKEKVSGLVFEIETLKRKNIELNEFIQSRNSLLQSQSQELFALKSSKSPEVQALNPNPRFSLKKIENFPNESEKRLEKLLNENQELTEKILKLSQIIQNNKEDFSDQLAVLQAEVDVLRLVKQDECYEKMKEDFVTTKNYLKEVRCLLAINEKELQEERTKRIHEEKTIKKLRKVLRNREVRHMTNAEILSLKNEIKAHQNTIKTLNQQILELKSNSEMIEKNLKDSLVSTREDLLHQMKTNEIHSRNIKKLINSFNELSQNLEKKTSENFFRDSYLNEAKTQKKLYQDLLNGNLQGKEIAEMCQILQNRFESLVTVQDQNSFKAIYQIEELRCENSKLKADIKKLESCEEKNREMLRRGEIVAQELREKLEKSKEISDKPEVLSRIVRLIHKSSLAQGFS